MGQILEEDADPKLPLGHDFAPCSGIVCVIAVSGWPGRVKLRSSGKALGPYLTAVGKRNCGRLLDLRGPANLTVIITVIVVESYSPFCLTGLHGSCHLMNPWSVVAADSRPCGP